MDCPAVSIDTSFPNELPPVGSQRCHTSAFGSPLLRTRVICVTGNVLPLPVSLHPPRVPEHDVVDKVVVRSSQLSCSFSY